MEILENFINYCKGRSGERKVKRTLKPLFSGKNNKNYYLINNLILIDENNKSHQIDHVLIRHNGIFCIETKNFEGRIYGNVGDAKWTQILGRTSSKFLNPVKQNKSHVFNVRRVLNNNYIVNSIVVFVKNNAYGININNVINLCFLNYYLDNFDDGTNYSIEEIEYIYNTLLESNNKISNKEHVKSINQTQLDIYKGICPRCHGKLVVRNGKYGKFIGCSNYPNCKFTMKIK